MQITSGTLSKISVSGNDVYIYSGNDYITMKNKATATTNVRLDNGTANVSENGNRVNIFGSNNTINGGAGNDTLTGGTGADTYVYSGGDDLITDYATVDAIQFDTTNIAITNVATVGSNVVYYTDAGNLTVKSGKTKKITLIDSNGAEFTYSNKNVAEDILFMEDNFISEDANLDSLTEITQDNYSVQNIEAKNYLEIEQPILTYSNDK